jgi:hypothetical protein
LPLLLIALASACAPAPRFITGGKYSTVRNGETRVRLFQRRVAHAARLIRSERGECVRR